MSPEKMVSEFHTAFGILEKVPFEKDGDIDFETLDLRCRLIDEEHHELSAAVENVSWAYEDIETPDEVKMHMKAALLKECCDVVYVVVALANKYGWNFDEAFKRVHASNMSKLGADGKPVYRQDGKVVKGPNYTPPDLTDLV